ncbi:NAD-P-binding protein [Vararia minispora EC-137]|uniref:NAD-P-binding protein n=1 Tax=Vararia minispora EC-137 TaxID=1314806 RepID=A0ACB8QGX3_9AGAM|nr:NAD-P-binding protein [Vararia minispora EC-137]
MSVQTGESAAKALASDIKGKTVIVTGVSPGGFGAETARILALVGAKVVLAGRSLSKIQAAAQAIKEEVPNAELKQLILDLGSQKAVREAAAEVLKYDGPVDVVILNAGVMGTPYAKSPEGLESQLATNHIGNFLFTNLIMPKLLESSAPRVVSASSVGHFWGPFRFDDYGFEDGETYDKWAAYGQSKTANILFAVELAERYKNKLTVFSCHPGEAPTGLFQYMTKEDFEKFGDNFNADGTPKGDWIRTVEECTVTYVAAGFDQSIADKSGSYVKDGKVANEQAAPYALDKESAKKLWDLSEKLVGQTF